MKGVKGLASMTNTQKAKMLCELFPSEMGQFVLFAAQMAQEIKVEREKVKTEISSNHFPATYWFGLADETLARIKAGENKLDKTPSQIGEQLFSGDIVFFVKHCLSQFVASEQGKKGNFRMGVELFFSIRI